VANGARATLPRNHRQRADEDQGDDADPKRYGSGTELKHGC
jgi:hypothetical protein